MAFDPTEKEVDTLISNKYKGGKLNSNTSNSVEDCGQASNIHINARDKQVGGGHYNKYEVQVWDIILMYKLDFFEGNMLKYLLRTKGDRKEDLLKLKHYLDKKLEGY